MYIMLEVIFFSIITIQTSLHGLKNENKTKSNEF